MKYNYPIKYAAMPIIEEVGWSHELRGLERKYDVVCYIVSKCYLLSSKIKYKENGKSEREFEVVFPYQAWKYYYGNWGRIAPPTNSNFVEEVFDTYEEALEITTKKNKELCENICDYLTYTDDFDNQISKKIKEFNDRLSKYKLLEQQILINTYDLEQSNVRKLDNLIVNDNDNVKLKVSLVSLYEYLNLPSISDYPSFIIYSISQEEYNKLIESINSKAISDTSKIFETATPLLYHKEKDENVMVIDQDSNVLYYMNERKYLTDNNDKKIPPVKLRNIDNQTKIFFTTEKLEDIVLSFTSHEYINPDKIQVPVLKKTLSDKNSK